MQLTVKSKAYLIWCICFKKATLNLGCPNLEKEIFALKCGWSEYIPLLQDHTAKPIAPSPNIATDDPSSTFAVLQAAPTPEKITCAQ